MLLYWLSFIKNVYVCAPPPDARLQGTSESDEAPALRPNEAITEGILCDFSLNF